MNVLDRNDGFWWPGMVRILGPCTVHAGCVFLFFAICSLLPFSSLFFLSIYPFLTSRFSGSVSSAWFSNLVSFSLIASPGLSSLLTPFYTSFNALLLYLTLAMTGWKTWSIIAVESCFQYLILFVSCWPLPIREETCPFDFSYCAFQVLILGLRTSSDMVHRQRVACHNLQAVMTRFRFLYQFLN